MEMRGRPGHVVVVPHECTGGPSLTARIVAVCILLAVALGFHPRWTCIPHWYIAFSLNTSIIVRDGGEAVAEIATMLLIPICLGDKRRWQWGRALAPMAAKWRGSAYAAHLALRLQALIIYADAALSKFASPGWRHGTAIAYVLDDPEFGAPPKVFRMIEPVIGVSWVVMALTWSVLAMEMGIAISAVGTRHMRYRALAMAIALHAAIILVMGLTSFGLVMIAFVALVCAGAGRWRHGRSP